MPILAMSAPGRFVPERLFRPGRVAVIGADTPDGRRVAANLAAGYAGEAIDACAPTQEAVAALPAAPDLAVVAAAAAAVPAVLAALAARGAGAAVVTTVLPGLEAMVPPGFGVLGAGSFGVCVPAIGLNASVSHLQPRPGRVAFVSQSTSLCRTVLDWAEPNGVGFSHVVGIGGNAGLGFDTVLDWLSRDAGTGVILLDLRRLQNRRGFVSAARAASRLRPVVAIRPGGRLLDVDGRAEAVFVAALRRAGILCVSRLEDFLAAAETLSRARPARRDGLAIVTNSTGLGRLAADAALSAGVALAALPVEARAVLAASLPVGFGEGVVHVGTDAPTRLAEAAAMLCARDEVGGVLAVLAPSGPADAAGVAALTACAATVRQPLLVCAPGETTGAGHRRTLAEAGLPVFATPEGAVRGFLHLVEQRRARSAAAELPPRTVSTVTPDHAAVVRLLAGARAAGRLELTQDEALGVLAAYGVAAVRGAVARSPAEAAALAATIGFPVALKRRRAGAGTAGRSGSVALDLADAEAVERAARRLAAAPDRDDPAVLGASGARTDTGADAAGLAAGRGAGPAGADGARPRDGAVGELLVQAQAPRSRELRVGVADDPLFGPAIAFGQGGSAADGPLGASADVAYDLPPLNLALAHALIARTRAGSTLSGRAELPDAEAGAVADALVRISQLVVDVPEIAWLELNPLLAAPGLAAGRGVLALDAAIGLRAPGEASFLAIAPYPAELSERWVSRRGEAFLLRPIRPEDAEAHGAMFARLSPEDVRFRFFSAMRSLSAEQMARMTQVDYTREMAFVAVREGTRPDGEGGGQDGGGTPAGETVGVARLVRHGPGRVGGSGEFAVVVQPDAKGQGLAGTLMRRLIAWGRAEHLERITGMVLADNRPMVAFVRRLGFTVRRLPDEPDVVEAELLLG